ncbi:spore germination protein [Paenibacillus monticola]|uniref:Spore germination protein n=1 Tax=Paenibacillus monticola TaxID=2666075 RepID=A0A7X2H634_9BACL|nr:spore germination protein [Paenibacillus monticola]MRN53448.1 spore germination protein [Paenibacillus monticola]
MQDPNAQAAEEPESGKESAALPPKTVEAKEPPQDSSKEKNKVDPRQKKRDTERSDSLEESIIYWQGHDEIPPLLEDTKNTLTEVMGLGSSFDVVFREMSFGGHKAALLCISGFAKDTIMDEILKRLTYLTPENLSTDVFASFMNQYIPHIQVEKGQLLSECINKVMSGMSAIFIEGETQVIVMDTRAYPSRNPDEPSIERVVRGSRDGFTETLLSNVALVRRRIRDPGLKYEMHQVGRRTRTDVCVAYIDDIVDKTQVKAVTDKIKSVNVDGIPLADKQLEEAIVGGGWNPYPLVRYSERPDTVASHLLEGRVVIFVDTSPSVMVLPTTFFDLCQHAEENRQTPFMGTYLRWVRFIGIFASMFLLPLWMLLVLHPELKPPMLEFIGPQKTAHIPLLAQFLIVELGVDLLRMAAVHTPTPLGSAMGLIAAILVGDIAVQTGLFVNEVVLYMAVASIGMFATPSYELGLANRIVRLALLIAVAAFQVPGFMIGSTLLVVLLTMHRSYNSSYLWPFIPFNAKAMGEILLRQPVLNSKTRPSFNKTRDNTRMPPIQENEQQS